MKKYRNQIACMYLIVLFINSVRDQIFVKKIIYRKM